MNSCSYSDKIFFFWPIPISQIGIKIAKNDACNDEIKVHNIVNKAVPINALLICVHFKTALPESEPGYLTLVGALTLFCVLSSRTFLRPRRGEWRNVSPDICLSWASLATIDGGGTDMTSKQIGTL